MEPNPTTRRFIDTVAPPHEWIVEIQNEIFNLNYLRSNEVWNRTTGTQRIHQNIVNRPEPCSKLNAELCRQYEEDPRLILGTIQCAWTEYVTIVLGRHLPHKSVNKICQTVFSADWLSDGPVETFYAAFFSVYLQREYSWQTLDLLYKAYEARPIIFMRLFSQHLMKNVKIPKIVIQDFVVNLKQELRNDFMKAVMEVTLTSEEFIHHLPTINLLFLDSAKTSMMCQYVFSNLKRHAPDCYTNRDFGRLLLSLMKNMAGANVDQKTIKQLIDSHGSEFKSPCSSFFDGLIGELVEMQYRMIGQRVVFCPPPFKGHINTPKPHTI